MRTKHFPPRSPHSSSSSMLYINSQQHHSTQKQKGLSINSNFSLRTKVFPFQHKAIMFIKFSAFKHQTSEVPNSSIITKFVRRQKESSSVAEVPLGHAQFSRSDKHKPTQDTVKKSVKRNCDFSHGKKNPETSWKKHSDHF